MTQSAVFNAVTILSGAIASLPLILYKRMGEHNKKRFMAHPLYDVLHNLPNNEMTSFTWREHSMGHLLLWGNCYSQIVRNRLDQVVELWPLNPANMEVKRNDSGRIIYILKESGKEDKTFQAKDILHIPGFGFDGRVGYSVIAMARESMGLGIAMEEFQARFYGSGTHIGGILEHPGKLGDEALKHLKASVKEQYGGLAKSHGLLILEENMKFQKIGMPLEDAQFLESKVFQIGDIARWFNLPPHKLKELSRATFSNIEHMQIEFVQDSVRPWLIKWEQGLAWKCLSREERKQYFAEFLISGLLRGDTEARMRALAIQRQNGIIDANEWRQLENQNPLRGKAGKAIWMPLNMTDANEPAPEVKPPPPPGAEPAEEEEEEEKALSAQEQRAQRALASRLRMKEAYKPVFKAIAREILAKEIPAVKKIARKAFKSRTTGDFIYEMGEFYTGFKDFVRKRFAGLFLQYGEAIYPLAADEIGASGELTDEYKAYLSEYTDHSANRYIESSRGQMKAVALKHAGNDALTAIEQRLDEWEERRPDKIANLETVNGESGTAAFVYLAGGFRTEWVAHGESCPYCESLNGKTVSQGIPFINAGQSFQPDGAEVPLMVTQNINHPAAHQGCDCSVQASITRSVRKIENVAEKPPISNVEINLTVDNTGKTTKKKIQLKRDGKGNIDTAEVIEESGNGK